jgi:hypothetical protein
MQALFLLLPWAVAAQTATYNIRPMQGNRFTLKVFKSKLWEGRKHTFLFDDSADLSLSIASGPSDRVSVL